MKQQNNTLSIKMTYSRILRRSVANYQLYLMLVPVLAFYIIFRYWPMYGVQIAFRDYNPGLGFAGSPWVDMANFRRLFGSFRFMRMLKNTLLLNTYQMIFQFPIPIVFAILVNEVRIKRVKALILNVTYLPHFLSVVVIVSLINTVFHPNYGIINRIIAILGRDTIRFMENPSWFRPIYIISGLWQSTGWNALIYLGALAAIDPSLYEAAQVDGASRFQQIIRITLPCITPTIIIMFILKLGGLMNLGVEKVLLMQNDLNISTSDALSVYVYKMGIREGDYSFATAADLFNNIINFALLLVANRMAKKLSGSSLW